MFKSSMVFVFGLVSLISIDSQAGQNFENSLKGKKVDVIDVRQDSKDYVVIYLANAGAISGAINCTLMYRPILEIGPNTFAFASHERCREAVTIVSMQVKS